MTVSSLAGILGYLLAVALSLLIAPALVRAGGDL